MASDEQVIEASGVGIRELRAGEGERVAELAAASPTAAHWSAADYEAVAASHSGKHICLVAEKAPGRLCGFIHVTTVADEGELLNIAVAASERRRGIARALLQQACERLKQCGAGVLWLEVRESNAAAMRFYSGHGFEPRGRRKAYYHDPAEDALVLSRRL